MQGQGRDRTGQSRGGTGQGGTGHGKYIEYMKERTGLRGAKGKGTSVNKNNEDIDQY